jgi:glycerophosphoryl diester phosphodiesterase
MNNSLTLVRILLILTLINESSAIEESHTTLIARAVLPAATFAEGPTSGTQLGKASINGVAVPFIDKQPVQGFSAILASGNGYFQVMSDNGFGSLEKSADYHLRVYTIKPDFKTKEGGTGKIAVKSFIELRDPNHLIPFAITNEFTPERILTGADFDIESFQKAPDGTLWFGDEFGPFLLHTDAQGILLDPPIPLPDFDNPGQEIRSRNNPFNEEGSAVRVMNAVHRHAQLHGNTKTPVFSPHHLMLKDGNPSIEHYARDIFNIKSLQKAGYPILTWTVNDKPRMLELMKLGLNGIISDRPDLLLQAVREFDANKDGLPGDFLTAEGLIDINQFDAQGHRGGRNLHPENTLPAMEVALDYLMTTLETDTGITKDGVPILKYEPYIENLKCRRQDGQAYTDEVLIKDLTVAEIQTTFTCDKNPGRGDKQQNEHKLSPVTTAFIKDKGLKDPYIMPTVQQLFDFVAYYVDYYQNGIGATHPQAHLRWQNAKKVRFNIETKINPRRDHRTVSFEQMADALAQIIQTNGMENRTDIQSFDFRTLIRVQQKFPNIRTVYRFSDFPKHEGSNLQDEHGQNTPWLAGLYWPYRVTELEQPFRAKPSGGFEGMAITPDGSKLITLLEKPLIDSEDQILLMHEFDLITKSYTGVRYQYPLATQGKAVGDFVLFAPDKGWVIERDKSRGDMNGFKMIYQITLNGNKVIKNLAINLLRIADPNHIASGELGDVGIGKTFGFPFVTIENIVVLGDNQLGVLNDNNYPFSVGRHVGSGQPDDNEFIILKW